MSYTNLPSNQILATQYYKWNYTANENGNYYNTDFQLYGSNNYEFINDNTQLMIGDSSDSNGNHRHFIVKIAFTIPNNKYVDSIKLQLNKGKYSGSGSVKVKYSASNYNESTLYTGLPCSYDGGSILGPTPDGEITIPSTNGSFFGKCGELIINKNLGPGTHYLYLYQPNYAAPLYGGVGYYGNAQEQQAFLAYQESSGGGDSGGGDSGGGDSGGGDSGIIGNIKKYEKITATDIANLKQRVQAIYANRSFLSAAGLKTLSEGSPGYGGTSITENNIINRNFYYALNALLQLQNITGVSKNDQNEIIFQTGVTADLLTTISNWHTTDPKSNTKPSSCRGGCVGFCYNECDGECTYACTTGSAGGSGSSSYDPVGTQVGDDCKDSCTAECSGNCKDICSHLCKDGCGDSCGNSCTGCTNTCGTACQGSENINSPWV